jgi:hypothetical protein
MRYSIPHAFVCTTLAISDLHILNGPHTLQVAAGRSRANNFSFIELNANVAQSSAERSRSTSPSGECATLVPHVTILRHLPFTKFKYYPGDHITILTDEYFETGELFLQKVYNKLLEEKKKNALH